MDAVRARGIMAAVLVAVASLVGASTSSAAPVPPPEWLIVEDRPWDDGTSLDIRFPLSKEDTDPANPVRYQIQMSGEYLGLYADLIQVTATPEQRRRNEITARASELNLGEPYWFRIRTVDAAGARSAFVETGLQGVRPRRQWFDGRRFWLLMISLLICAAVIWYIVRSRLGARYTIRRIAGLDAMEDAVGRATEMGRACLFVPGVQDINEIQTIAGLTVLGRIAERAADYDCELDVPTSRSLVMTAARETLAAAYSKAGHPEAYREDAAYYVTDEQFGYVAHLTGKMVREKPAACFYMGSFFAESLILAETGNAIGAIQIAGTAQPAQLPFFVAACDYTLIGEEFFAASAYLSGDPDQIGTLKGQDFGKFFVAVVVAAGVLLSLAAGATGSVSLKAATAYLRNSVLGE